MRAHEAKTFVAAGDLTPDPFVLEGGRYQVSSIGTSVVFNQLGPDGSTYIPLSTNPVTDGTVALFDLPPGQYQFVGTGAGAFQVVRVPVGE